MTGEAKRLMPARRPLGQHMACTVGHAIDNWTDKTHPTPNNFKYREVMGFFLPPWQRGLVWSEQQSIKFIESLWYGLSVGTYTYNRSKKFGSHLDNLLVSHHTSL